MQRHSSLGVWWVVLLLRARLMKTDDVICCQPLVWAKIEGDAVQIVGGAAELPINKTSAGIETTSSSYECAYHWLEFVNKRLGKRRHETRGTRAEQAKWKTFPVSARPTSSKETFGSHCHKSGHLRPTGFFQHRRKLCRGRLQTLSKLPLGSISIGL